MKKSHYSLSKWGDKSVSEPIKDNMIALIEEHLEMKIDSTNPKLENNEAITDLPKSKLPNEFLLKLKDIVGEENISSDTHERLEKSIGKSYYDAINMRKKNIKDFPEVIIYPRSEDDVIEIIQLCNSSNIPIIPLGGRSSVTQGIDFSSGGVAVDLTVHMNKIVNIDPISQSVKTQPGIYGPEFEKQLNEFENDHPNGYTCGHFPQSFEYSTVGGWLATRGAGQESTGYGKIEHMVLGLRMVTPQGVLVIKEYPARSTGPDLIQLVIGSEGTFGIITEITMKIHRRYPENTKYFAILFKDWESSLEAVREIMQQRFGHPFVFRLSDPEETYVSIRTVGLPNWKEKFLQFRGYHPMERTLLMGSLEGSNKFTKMMLKQLKNIAKQHGGFSIGSSSVKHWLETRYSSAYLRDSFISAGIVLDTLETSCTWTNIHHVWKEVRDLIKSRDRTVVMTHLSHIYENGANLYFIFLFQAKDGEELEDFAPFHQQIIKKILETGGSLSHHHGIGSLLSPYFEQEIGTIGYEILKTIKEKLDPNNIMNPKVLFN